MIKGNHDYWWGSLKKLAPILPSSIHLIQNNSFRWKEAAIAGARLWDTPEYSFGSYIEFRENPRERISERGDDSDNDAKIFARELERLKLSLASLPADATIRIAMTHYPPISATLEPSRASRLLEEYGIQICVFGHLHNIKSDLTLFGEKNGVHYILASGDYVRFQLVPIQ